MLKRYYYWIILVIGLIAAVMTVISLLFYKANIVVILTVTTLNTMMLIFLWFFIQDIESYALNKQKTANLIRQMENLNVQRSEFLHLAAHQLKNPIVIIKFILYKFKDHYNLSKDKKKEIKTALFQTEMMMQFIEDIIRIIRTEGSSTVIEKKETNIELLVKKILNELNAIITNKKIHVTKHISSTIPNIVTDPIYLKVAITNLIDNACKYSPENSKITIRINQENNNHIKISVSDEGIGIARADTKRVFEKFFRGQNAKSLIPNGTGLGLYLVKLIAGRLNGKISFTSELNKGSTFTLEIPV